MSVPPPIPVKRSMLVTVVAWIFIGLSAVITLALLLESLLLPRLILPMLYQQLASAPASVHLSPAAQFLFDHAVGLCRGMLLVAMLHLIAAVSLLWRKDWGRRLMLVMLGFDLLYQFAIAALQWWVVGPMQHAMLQMQFGPGSQMLGSAHLSPQMQAAQAAQLAQMLPIVDSMMAVTRVLGVIAAAVFIIVLGWLIMRLSSQSIRSEFTARPALP
ncbi:hypothetical protein [Rhodanobacter sp. BL-MT-08]